MDDYKVDRLYDSLSRAARYDPGSMHLVFEAAIKKKIRAEVRRLIRMLRV